MGKQILLSSNEWGNSYLILILFARINVERNICIAIRVVCCLAVRYIEEGCKVLSILSAAGSVTAIVDRNPSSRSVDAKQDLGINRLHGCRRKLVPLLASALSQQGCEKLAKGGIKVIFHYLEIFSKNEIRFGPPERF